MPDAAIEVKNLSKTYKGAHGQPEKHALNDVSLTIPRGSFFALLGPNGAGKSTFINILAGLVTKTSGDANIWGYDIEDQMRAARRSIGIVPQELNLDPFFNPRELLEVQAGLYGVPKNQRRTDEILEAVGLADKATSYARTLSGGMRRRLLVAKAMVHSPQILVLDEPTAGVDIELRMQLWDYVRELNRMGTTVLLTTHYLEEAEELCDKVAIINHGRLVACDETQTLLSKMDAKELIITISEIVSEVPVSLRGFGFNVTLQPGNKLSFQYSPSKLDVAKILELVSEANLTITDLTTKESDLEDLFLRLTREDNAKIA
ncbi:ABC transporter ATP-binding protein [Terasakiella sp. A23]|uniref:ABC transporter ATP-binding protein n=1 Tax=Terasakiella sp. FCG-A23 TaxID=3080561 RepID=UPI0029546964|nr:ABC transporter ATP-binding protein [Terasakiella sp. A23]MDV7339488.1 ABC transporter ATP-binding protein [Terasakiella sp. A23]